MKINYIPMKWFVLASISAMLIGFIYTGRGFELKEKSGSSQVEYKKDLPAADLRSVNDYPGAALQEKTVSQTETDNGDRLFYKNIVVCIL